MKKTKLFLSVFVLLLTVMFLFGCERDYAGSDVYITLDINPSIEMIVSEQGKVLHVIPLNEDAELLLVGLTLRGLNVEEAIDIIIEEAIKLGFIDIDSDENIILVDAQAKASEIRERIMERIKEEINEAFKKRSMIGRAEDQSYLPDHVLEAQSHGVTPGFLRLAKAVADADDEMTVEEALEMSTEDLIGILKAIREERREVAQNIREAFLDERQALMDEYKPLIDDLLAQIENQEGEVDQLMLQVEALRAELHQKLETLREEFLVQSDVLRLQLMNQRHARLEEHQARVNDFLESAEERRESMKERIEEFQRGQDRRP